MAIAKYWFEKYNAVPALISHDIVDYYLPASQSDKNIAREIAEEQFGYCEDIVLQGCENITFLDAIILNSQIWSFWWDWLKQNNKNASAHLFYLRQVWAEAF